MDEESGDMAMASASASESNVLRHGEATAPEEAGALGGSPAADNAIKAVLSDPLVLAAAAVAQAHMARYDGSHDWSHVRRVLGLSLRIWKATAGAGVGGVGGSESPTSTPDLLATVLAALLHDVGDRKYLEPGEDAATLVSAALLGGLPGGVTCAPSLAEKVQAVCLGVSYSAEVRGGPQRMAGLLAQHPELAVVQDADRLDALGAVGVARCFAYGGAKAGRALQESVDHFGEKLVKLEDMMKTDEGRRIARERTRRISLFEQWWDEEVGMGESELGDEVGLR